MILIQRYARLVITDLIEQGQDLRVKTLDPESPDTQFNFGCEVGFFKGLRKGQLLSVSIYEWDEKSQDLWMTGQSKETMIYHGKTLYLDLLASNLQTKDQWWCSAGGLLIQLIDQQMTQTLQQKNKEWAITITP